MNNEGEGKCRQRKRIKAVSGWQKRNIMWRRKCGASKSKKHEMKKK